MKRLLAILLLSLFAYGTVGYYIAFNKQRSLVRHEVKQRIKKGVPIEELTIITDDLNNSQLNWVKPNKEFRLNGKMYDVVYKQVEGNTIYYSCINDTQEEELFEDLDEQVNKEMNNNSNKKLKNSLKDYLPNEQNTSTLIGAIFIVYPQWGNNYNSPYMETTSPPPPFNS